jgi:hypothetical protein
VFSLAPGLDNNVAGLLMWVCSTSGLRVAVIRTLGGHWWVVGEFAANLASHTAKTGGQIAVPLFKVVFGHVKG